MCYEYYFKALWIFMSVYKYNYAVPFEYILSMSMIDIGVIKNVADITF